MSCSYRPWLLAVLLLCGFVSIGSAQSTRAMWLWQTDSIIDNTYGAQSRLFAFCSTPPGAAEPNRIGTNAITTLYLYCHTYVHGDTAHRGRLHRFLADAHAHNLSVHFLDGAPDWATTGRTYGE